AATPARVAQARLFAVPSIEIGGAYDRHHGTIQETGGSILDVDRVSRFTGLSAGLRVDIADAVFQPLVARQNRAAAQAAAAANRHLVLLDVATTYLGLLRARAEAELASASLERARDLERLTSDYAEVGEGLLA